MVETKELGELKTGKSLMTVRQNIKEVVKMTIALFITARSLGALARKAKGANTVVQHVNH